ncbi:MAG: hypothetical protein ABFS56_25310, partial [Pseudomonadota bacterium]
MFSAKTTNTSLALAVSAVLATTSSQAIPIAPNHTSDSTLSNGTLLLAYNVGEWETYTNSKYTYSDAELLANYWDKPTPWDAKLKIGSLIKAGDDAAVANALRGARANAPQAYVEQQQWDAYANSKYTYSDAELLAAYWGKSTPWDAKLKIGRLIKAGDDAAVAWALAQANVEQQQWEAYTNSKYTYSDAELLAAYWGKSTHWDAKLKIGRLIKAGDDAAVAQALQQARANAPQASVEQQQWEAYTNSKYTYSDA